MKLEELFQDKTIKQKAKTEGLSRLLLDKKLDMEALIVFAEKAKSAEKATCIEALEYATRQKPEVADEKCLQFVSCNLADEAPRVRWESAKVIGNIAHLFPANLDTAIGHLLTNTEYHGTVVRWAAAYALGEILKLKTKYNEDLLPAIEAICDREENKGVQKKYLDALKKAKK
ncbi:MAG: HEAT repeat domain-containing protein [Saprospiraceae bacterium]|nr:HEAT repeat domain-containing protein [Saprospiraceae bacterium]